MKLTYERIKNKPKVLMSLTTLRREEFKKVGKFLENSWRAYIQRNTLKGKPRNKPSRHKKRQVSSWIKLLSKLLREALDKQGFLPVRKA